MTFLGGFQDCQVSYSPQIIYPQTPSTSSLGKPWFSQTSSTWSERALLWMGSSKLASYLLFSPSFTVLLCQGEGSHGGFDRFLPKTFHAVHGLTFLFRALAFVLFHPADTATMCMEIPL